jgi:excisionase family DNA binding protein
MKDDDPLLSLREAATVLGVHPTTVWRYIQRGDLAPARTERPSAIRRSDVLAFQDKPRPKPGPKPGTPRPRQAPPVM